MLEAYRDHVADRAAMNIPPKPLSPQQVADVVELLKAPPASEEDYLVDLISNRVPPGVDEAIALETLIRQNNEINWNYTDTSLYFSTLLHNWVT